MEGCAALQRGGNFWVGSGDGFEIKLGDRDIGKNHTGLRVNDEGIVWITDIGGRGGTRMTGTKLEPHTEKRLRGDEFWCGRNSRHFRVSGSIPSSGDFLPEDSEGGRGESPPERPAVQDNTERKTARAGDEGRVEQHEGPEIWFNWTMQRGQVDDFVIVWTDRGEVKHNLLRNGHACWMGAETGAGITWDGSLRWRGRLEATQGLLSLSTEWPSMVK